MRRTPYESATAPASHNATDPAELTTLRIKGPRKREGKGKEKHWERIIAYVAYAHAPN